MAKEKRTKEEVPESAETVTLTISDGIRFGLGFFMVNAVCIASIGLVAWLIIEGARYFGLVF